MVQDGSSGLTYSSREELERAIAQLCTDRELREKLAQNAYRRYVDVWSEDAHLGKYFEVLRQTAKEKHGFVPWESLG
jgi:glycosyltransferase involved in cell wall biosynthesis